MDLPPAYIDYRAASPAGGTHWIMTAICWFVILGVVAVMVPLNALGTQSHLARTTMATSATPNLSMEILGRTILFQTAHVPATTQPGKTAADKSRQQMLDNVRRAVVSPADQLDLVILTRESAGLDAANEAMRTAISKLPADGNLRADAGILNALYSKSSGTVPALDRAKLQKDLGWFGQLAVSQDRPENSPERQAIIASANRGAVVLIGGTVLVLLAFVAGIALLIALIVLFCIGTLKWKYLPVLAPISGAPVFLECFALWLVCYIGMSKGLSLLNVTSMLPHELVFVGVTFLVALWPLARGVTWPQLREALGWNRGRGIFIEIGFGACAYIAGLPLIGIAIYVSSLLMKLTHTPSTHPIVEEFTAGMSVGQIMILFVSAAICAPLLEETIFRGALYSHLRRRWRPWISAIVVSLIFAAIHPQGWTAIPVLGTIALVLAALREWRGSLVASMTAHAINNGALVLFMGLALR
jgi:membrane protease YdiL (CAAX protease family)